MKIKEWLKKNSTFMSAYHKLQKTKYETLTRISPKLNTAVRYRHAFGKRWDPKHPVTLNDKVLWLKFNTYWKNPLVKQCADKYKVREYINGIGCGEILNDLLAVYKKADEIEWDMLPDQFVIKLNVGCGYNIIVDEKRKFKFDDVKKLINGWLNEKYYLAFSEMQYKDVEPYILVEKYLQPKEGLLPEDYKFYCFDGTVPYVMVCTERENGGHPRFWYYNENWEMQMMTRDALKYGSTASIQKPEGIDKAFEYARKISKGFPFVRVDLYLVDGKVIFGEMTFTPSGGLDTGRLKETDLILGKYTKLPNK